MKLRNGNRVYVLRKLEKDNFTSWLSRGEEKLTGKSDAYGTCRVVVLLIEPIVFLTYPLPSSSWFCKVPNISDQGAKFK